MTEIDFVNITDIETVDTVPAYSLEVGDQIVADGDYIEITSIEETDDVDEVLVKGYSHTDGDRVSLSLFADDLYPIWTV